MQSGGALPTSLGRVAPVQKRFGLAMIFGFSALAILGGDSLAVAQTDVAQATGALSATIVALILALIPLAYTSTEVFLAATPGKLILGLKIRNEDGSDATT